MNAIVIPILTSNFKFFRFELAKDIFILDLNNKNNWINKFKLNFNKNVAIVFLDKDYYFKKNKIDMESLVELIGFYLFIKIKKTMNFENGYEVKLDNNHKIISKNKPKLINFTNRYGLIFLSFYNVAFGRDRLNILKRVSFKLICKGKNHLFDYYVLIRSQLHPNSITPLGLAMNSFMGAYVWFMDDNAKLILNVTALEALFLISSNELLHRLSHNISFYLYPLKKQIKQRLETYNRVKKIYSSRSTLVHGGEVELNLESYDEVCYVFTEVIEKMIEVYKHPNIFINRVKHKNFIKYLELGYFIR